MTQDDIIRMAREAGFVEYELDDGTTGAFDKRYESFAKLAAEKAAKREREVCAKVCENLPAALEEFDALGRAADAIRARGQ